MMTSTAKTWLKKTVRSLRERLLADMRAEVDSRYKLALTHSDAVLSEEQRNKRVRLEDWLKEQVRAGSRGAKEKDEKARERHLQEAVKLAAATFLNRLVVVRQMEHLGLLRSKVLMGGWSSSAYKEFRELAPAVRHMEAEGYPFLLQMVFEELSLELPGLFGEVGLSELLPVSPAMWRETVETLEGREDLTEDDRRGLWEDDTLLGWVYQFWNDPDREALDEKISSNRGKIENHELASKTQLFTDRYMVEWLLQNALGQFWFAVCRKNGWTPEAVSQGALEALETRRRDFREKRERGEVSLETLMPIESELEERWKYWVSRVVNSQDGPSSLRDFKLLDPACGSGHFLVIALDLLFALYEEEARHRGESWSREQIACWILENNLHGIDIDGRAIQMAKAALWVKMKRTAPKASFKHLNLVSTDFDTAQMSSEHLEQLSQAGSVADLKSSLQLARYLGALVPLATRHPSSPGSHSRSAVEIFLELNQPTRYDLVVLNPPYQTRRKMASPQHYTQLYPEGSSDLFAGFMLRSLELCKKGGLMACITPGNWQFLTSYRPFRDRIMEGNHLSILAELGRSAFASASHHIITSLSLFQKGRAEEGVRSLVVRAFPPEKIRVNRRQVLRNEAALLADYERYEFSPELRECIPGAPLIFWWSQELWREYQAATLIGDSCPAYSGLNSGDNDRFIRFPWELAFGAIPVVRYPETRTECSKWSAHIKGAAGKAWIEPLSSCIKSESNFLEIRLQRQAQYTRAELFYHRGVAFSTIGESFSARIHFYASSLDGKGASVFPEHPAEVLCSLNTSKSNQVMNSLNSTVSYQPADVNRLPLFSVPGSDEILARLEAAFLEHERTREQSVEFRKPGASCWLYAQEWAQRAVDRPAGSPLPPYRPEYVQATAADKISYAFGLALGRFDPSTGLRTEPPSPGQGIFVLFGPGDSLDQPQAAQLLQSWDESPVCKGELRDYLRTDFFKNNHLKRYKNRPIYFPLCSALENYVAFISIHAWDDNTLERLLADHLNPLSHRLTGELHDMKVARVRGTLQEQGAAQAGYENHLELLQELENFIRSITEIAEKGPPPTSPKDSPREVDAPFRLHLEDGVKVNSAALWPLLEPQWREPRKWWSEFSRFTAGKTYLWARLAKRYFPSQVQKRCQEDPSIARAHDCLWEYHPEVALEWEHRLQAPEELGPNYRLEEASSEEARRALQSASKSEKLARRTSSGQLLFEGMESLI